MTQRYTRRFRVRYYELDAAGHVADVTVIRYMQEAAIEASAALGLGPQWYRERGTLWVVRRLSIRLFAPATYGDEIEILTWISGMRGVRSTREYDIGRLSDGARVARARVEWVYIEAQTGQPIRCPDDWSEALPRSGKREDLGVRSAAARPTDAAHRYTSRHRVQFHEVDGAQHVNHAVYLGWTAAAYRDALRAVGHAQEPTHPEGWTGFPSGHEVQFFAPALDNDTIEVVSWVSEVGEADWAWTHEVVNADTRQLLARDYSVGTFVNPAGRAKAVEEILRGPG